MAYKLIFNPLSGLLDKVWDALSLQDSDGDTLVQVEESADEDKIRFDTGGVERMIIDDAGGWGLGATPTVANPRNISHTFSSGMINTGLLVNAVGDNSAIAALRAFSAMSTVTHTSGSITNVLGFEGGVTINSSGGTVINAIALQPLAQAGNAQTPTITNLFSMRTIVDAEDATVTNAIGVYAQDPLVDSGSITRQWAILASGDVQLFSDKKLILEGSLTVKGDSYLVFNAATTDVDMFVDGTKCQTWDDDQIDFFKQISTLGKLEAINAAAKTANYTVAVTDENILCDTSGGAFTITLPAAPETGRLYAVILKVAGNNLAIDGNGNNINGSASIALTTANEAVQLVYDSSQWNIK